jgi:hypothetical protein
MLFANNPLLDPADRQQAGLAGLSALAQGLMMGGAPSLQPGGMARGLAEGFAGFGKNFQGSLANSVAMKSAALQQQMAQTQVAEAQRKQAAQQKLSAAMAGVNAPVQVADASQQGAVGMANRMNGGTQGAQLYQQALQSPDAQSALMELYGPAGIAAMRQMNAPVAVGADQGLYVPGQGWLQQPGRKPPEGFEPDGQGGLRPIKGGPADPTYLGAKSNLTEPLQKVLNPDGTVKYVRRSQAEGATAPDGAMIVMGPDGKPLFMRGGSQAMQGMVSGLGQKAQNEVQEQLLNTTAQLAQVNRISEKFKPEFQQIGTRAGMAWSAIKDKGGMTLDPQDRRALGEFTQYRAEAANFYADRLKAMSGSAVTEHEMKRQSAYLPNPGTGVFDGDSPTELAAKNSRMREFFQNVTARLHYVSKNGMDIKNVSLEKMPEVIRDRGNALEGEFKKRGLDGDQLKAAVRRQLAGEFGLVNE